MVFIGVGVEALRLDKSRRLVAEVIAPRVGHWSVRSGLDRRRLIEYGVRPEAITVAADMAWLLDPAGRETGRARLQACGIDASRPLIGVNLVNENGLFDRNPGLVQALAEALDELAGSLDARVIFLCNEVREGAAFDKAAASMVIARMRRASRAALLPNDYLSPDGMMSIISCCSLTVSMRYHFCLFSALERVPFIAIQRSDKLVDLCCDLDWSAAVAPPDFKALDLIEHAMRLKHSGAAVAEQLQKSSETMRARALCNLTALKALKGGGPLTRQRAA